MITIDISAETAQLAIEEGLQQLGIPRDTVETEVLSSAHDDTLPGAEPLPGVTVRLKVSEDKLIAHARQHLRRLLELCGINAQIEVLMRRGGVSLNIIASGEGSLIIGRNGQNLEALQVLVNRMVIHGARDLFPIFVDCEGYLEKRLSRLESNAQRAARHALREGMEVPLEPMSAFERKIVHNAMKEIRGIHTLSRGEGLDRHIVICPGEDSQSVLDRRRLKPHRGPRPQSASRDHDDIHGNAGEPFVHEDS